MSRYLDYTDVKRKLREKYVLKSAPVRRWEPFCFPGPEEEFKAYLRSSYSGKSLVCGGGRFATGPTRSNLIFTIAMTFLPGVYYYAFLCSSPGSFVGVCQIILAIMIVISLLSASFLNPGIVPRQRRIPRELDDFRDHLRSEPLHRFLKISEKTVKQKFCMTCRIFRPPRSKHCSICDNCVLRFDHHCTWLGNCIGLHNYRYFVVLIYSASLFLVFSIYQTCHVLCNEARGGEPDYTLKKMLFAVLENPFKDAFLVYCIFLLGATLLLAIYHTVIMCMNLTTNEHVRNYYDDNPFDFGSILNCAHICCHPERVLAKGRDTLEIDYAPFNTYNDFSSDDDTRLQI